MRTNTYCSNTSWCFVPQEVVQVLPTWYSCDLLSQGSKLFLFWQNHRPLHEDSRQDNLQRHHSLQCGIPYRLYWILWSYVHGAESHRQTRSVHVRCFSIVRVLSRVFEGQKLPPQNAQLPPKKYCYYYGIQVTLLERSSKRDEVLAPSVTFLKIVSQNAPDCISAHIHFKKLPRGIAPDPPRKIVAFGHSELLPQTINARQNPDCNHNMKHINSVGGAIEALIKSFDTVILLVVLYWSEWIILSGEFFRIGPSHLLLR